MGVASSELSTNVTPEVKATARITGLFYLGLAVTGILSFMLVRNQLFVSNDPHATLANIGARPALARAGVALEMGITLTQTLTAVWFYRLFRHVDGFAAGVLAAFGLVNAVLILGSAAMLTTALEVASTPSAIAVGDATTLVQLLYIISGNLWSVGAIFFGLWLLPMGWLVLRSGWLPQALGWLLVVGGFGYVLNAFIAQLLPSAHRVASMLILPATASEFWIVGYLLAIGVRQRVRQA